VTQDQYQTWLSNQELAAQKPATTNAQAGYNLFTGSGGCVGCHGIVGVDLTSFSTTPPANQIGPNLTHFGSRRTIAGGVLQWSPSTCVVEGTGSSAHIVNEQDCALYQWLHNPQAVKPGNDMQIRTLSDTEIAQLVAYLESLT
jgi:cytochrome c oxidase subunit 2